MIEIKQDNTSIIDMSFNEVLDMISNNKGSNNNAAFINLLLVSKLAIKTLKIAGFSKEIKELDKISKDIVKTIDMNIEDTKKEIPDITEDRDNLLIRLASYQHRNLKNIKRIIDIINNTNLFSKTSKENASIILSGIATINFLCVGIADSCVFVERMILEYVSKPIEQQTVKIDFISLNALENKWNDFWNN